MFDSHSCRSPAIYGHFSLGLSYLTKINIYIFFATLRTEFRVAVREGDDRDFKIWYGEALVRRQIVKITSGDVMSRVPLRLPRRSLAFYYGKVPSFTYSSLREYKPAVYLSF